MGLHGLHTQAHPGEWGRFEVHGTRGHARVMPGQAVEFAQLDQRYQCRPT